MNELSLFGLLCNSFKYTVCVYYSHDTSPINCTSVFLSCFLSVLSFFAPFTTESASVGVLTMMHDFSLTTNVISRAVIQIQNDLFPQVIQKA